MMLREYQKRLVDGIEQAFQHHDRVLGYLPTGGGKTEVAMHLIRQLYDTGRRALVIVERRVLAHQWLARLERAGMLPGLLQGENSKREYATALVATAQTIRSRGIPERVELIVIDESHLWHKTHDEVLARYPNVKTLGLTATPLREGLGLRFSKIVPGALVRELVADGFLVPARYFAPGADTIQTALESVNVRAGDFDAVALSYTMGQKRILGDVVSTWLERAENRPTIAFCVDKAHARQLAEEFVLEGVAAASVTENTKDEERAAIFNAFAAGDLKVLTSVTVLAVGFDMPVASCVVLARPTLSWSLYLQQVGRGLRPYPGKSDCLVLDHATNCLRFGPITEFEPPDALSTEQEQRDKRDRRAPDPWIACRKCGFVYSRELPVCPECGAFRIRRTGVVVLDGELRSVDLDEADESLPTEEHVRRAYSMFRWFAASKNMRKIDGFSYFKTLEFFKLKSGTKLPHDWRFDQPIPPAGEIVRWLENQRRRYLMLQRIRAA